MATNLPNLTTPALLVEALLAAGAWIWGQRQQGPSGDLPAAQPSLPQRNAPTSVDPQELLERAIATLESQRSLSAKVRQTGSMFGQDSVGQGVYLQQYLHQRDGDKLLFRLDLRIQLGDESSSLAQVCDERGQFWCYEKVPGDEAVLSLIDTLRVERYLEETGQKNRLEGVGDWPGLGGLPKLLRGLHNAFQFVAADGLELRGQPPVPVWRLFGRWNTARLAEFLPESPQAAAAGGSVDPAALPPQLPEQVVLFLGKEDLFPYRIEYRRDTVGETGKQAWSARWLLTLELFEVSSNAAIPPTRFKFPTSLDYTDKTDAFIDALEQE